MLIKSQTASDMGQGKGEGEAAEDKLNADPFEDSGCSDRESNCSEESLEGLASQQGAKDEAVDKVSTVAKEKEDNKGCHPQHTGSR